MSTPTRRSHPRNAALTTTHPNQPPAPRQQKIHTMPPVMNRQASQKRCRDGWELRRRGRTWQEVADESEPPFRSRQAAQKAVQTWLAANPPDELETMRRATGDTLVETATKMLIYADEARGAGKYRDAAELAKVGIDGLDKHAKLTGQHVVVPKEVNVHVQSVHEIIASTRAQLMAALDAETIVDAEIVEQPRRLEA